MSLARNRGRRNTELAREREAKRALQFHGTVVQQLTRDAPFGIYVKTLRISVSELGLSMEAHAVGDVDIKTSIEAARSIAHLRRRIWKCKLGMFVALLCVPPFFET